ncbi:MAG: hypothetical protein IJJ26_13405 [Victivallales bacterium]|nr:hypothetical protein [Victivallales bacterium]
MKQLQDNREHKASTVLLCAAMVFALFVSLSVVVLEAHHRDCTGEGCPICALLQQAEDALLAMGFGADMGMPLVVPRPVLAQTTVPPHAIRQIPLTPILLKTRQNK